MKPNFYQVAIIVFLAGLFGYFVWPTLYSYEDIKVRNYPNKSMLGFAGLLSTAGDEDVRIRTHRINGTAEKDLGLGRWMPFVVPPECSLKSSAAKSNSDVVFESYASSQINEALIPCVPVKVEAYDRK